MSDGFSMDFEKLGDLIEKLNLLDDNVNAAVRTGIHEGAALIEAEQKRLAPSKTASAIKTGSIYSTKKGKLKVDVGYLSESFKKNGDKDGLGLIGTIYEFGRPGESSPQRSSDTMIQKRGGKEYEVKKGEIQPVPHIRRGFDNKSGQAVEITVKYVKDKIGEVFD